VKRVGPHSSFFLQRDFHRVNAHEQDASQDKGEARCLERKAARGVSAGGNASSRGDSFEDLGKRGSPHCVDCTGVLWPEKGLAGCLEGFPSLLDWIESDRIESN